VTLELPDSLLDSIVERLAPRLAEKLAGVLPTTASSPWMNVEEAAEYTHIALGTFRKASAAGAFRAHGGKTKVYHRDELDADLGALPAESQLSKPPTPLRRAS
jgi:hypothetical protein